MPPVLHVSAEPALGFADRVAELLASAIEERGVASIALSGGSSPRAAFETLGRRRLPWDRVHVFQVDERVAPPGHPDRNLVAQLAALPDAVWHPMPVGDADPAEAARRYAAELIDVLGPEPALDVAHLGLGADGHTASWPPGRALPDATVGDVVTVAPFNGRARLTLTPACVNRARSICWLVPGAGRQLVLGQVLAGDRRHPAAAVRRDPDVEVFADRWPVLTLDHRDPAVATRLVELQRLSYAVEAKLIGYDRMPGLVEEPGDLAARPITVLAVVDADGRPRGAVGYTIDDGVVDIDRLVVHPAWFRRGVGRSLMLALHDIEAPAHRFEVSTATANRPAVALYKGCGYSVIRTESSDGVELVHLAALRSAF